MAPTKHPRRAAVCGSEGTPAQPRLAPVDGFPAPAGAIALAGPPDPAASELDWLTGRYRDVADAVAEVDRPLVLAGDCLTSLGLVAGLQRRHRDISLAWLDAHGDFNTPEISA